MAEIRNKDETSKPSNHSGREQKRSYKQHIKTLNTTETITDEEEMLNFIKIVILLKE